MGLWWEGGSKVASLKYLVLFVFYDGMSQENREAVGGGGDERRSRFF